MASTIQNAKINDFAAYLTQAATQSLDAYRQIYEQNRHRVYALAFWMTDNELTAEELLKVTFRRAFAHALPSAETLDRTLIAELRASLPIGTLTLNCAATTTIASVRRNTLRVHLERAVVQLPATERLVFLMHDVEGYDHERIARTLELNEQDSQIALHQARLRIRELLSGMVS